MSNDLDVRSDLKSKNQTSTPSVMMLQSTSGAATGRALAQGGQWREGGLEGVLRSLARRHGWVRITDGAELIGDIGVVVLNAA